MEAITTRFRSLWILGVVLPVLAGIVSFIFEKAINNDKPCATHSSTGGAGYDAIFLALALLPGVVVGLIGWRSRRSGADTVGPFCVAMCLAIFLVFIGLAAAWGGRGCMI